jgi:hypothetical protein
MALRKGVLLRHYREFYSNTKDYAIMNRISIIESYLSKYLKNPKLPEL